MAEPTKGTSGVTPTLGLTGATVNAMALIAPGAFLWITYQLQAAATAPSGASVANDMWAGIFLALIVAFLTAISYAQLAARYPEAGFGSAYYFAEKAFLDKEESTHHKWARLAKIVTGWAAHLFYWVYPGVMVAFMATLIAYIYNAFTGADMPILVQCVIAIAFAFFTGYVAFRGVTGSTTAAVVVNVVQIVSLVTFSVLAIVYRIMNPEHATQWAFSGGFDVVMPHSFEGVLVQSTIAILILVGFESCSALAAETHNPRRNIPRAIILSLVIQGLICYLFEYFAGSFMVSEKLVSTVAATPQAAAKTVMGMEAAAASGAPIGDMAILLGNALLGGIGFGLMITIAITVAWAVFGTTLSCLNTAVRITYAMSQDEEMPEILNALHGRYTTPHRALWVLVAFSCVIAIIGLFWGVVGLTGITLASNFGTFVLYGLTCMWTLIAFKGQANFSVLKHGIIPVLGMITNVIMLAGIIYLYFTGNADSQTEAYICFSIAGIWAAVSAVYVVVSSSRKGKAVIGARAV
jgi:basic amino acid/polyamine antiporter, APA family